MKLIYWKNRTGEGFSIQVGDSLGWPVIDTPNGDVALNPATTMVRSATSSEAIAFECGRRSRGEDPNEVVA